MPTCSLPDGVYEGLPFEEYAAIDAINGSKIVHMRRSPMFYKFMADSPPPATPAQILGTATHRLILEPNRVGDFAVWGSDPGHFTEKHNLRPRIGKDWEAFALINADKMLVTSTERDAMVGMATAARRNTPIRKYAGAKGPTEVSLVWTDRVSGCRMKCRLDKWVPATKTIFDLKTTVSCTPRRFFKQSYDLGYHIKMAIQRMGAIACFGVNDAFPKLGAVEKNPPHESAVYRLTKDLLILGMDELDVLLKRKAECEETNTWPAEMEDESDLLLPKWATPTETEEDFALEGLELA